MEHKRLLLIVLTRMLFYLFVFGLFIFGGLVTSPVNKSLIVEMVLRFDIKQTTKNRKYLF